MGAGIDGVVHDVAVLPNGHVVAAGHFPSAGGVSASNVATWDGSTWSSLGSGTNGLVTAIAVGPGGDLVVVGDFSVAGGIPADDVARWDGSTWSSLGAGPGLNFVEDIAVLPSGDLAVGGNILLPGVSGVMRWNGSTWSPLGSNTGLVRTLAVSASGSLLAAFGFGFAAIREWNGTAWTQLGGFFSQEVHALQTLHNGDIVAGGAFTTVNGALVGHLARWNGSTWSPLGAGTNGGVTDLALTAAGELVVGGGFSAAGGAVSARLARYAATCPATATVHGVGCPGSGGANQLGVQSLPWIGSTFTARGTGLPSFALISIVSGFSTISLPLAAILPQGVAGCDLLVAPDFVYFAVATAGTVTTSITIPPALALVSATFHQQLNPFELDASLNIVAVTASNALTMTVGAF